MDEHTVAPGEFSRPKRMSRKLTQASHQNKGFELTFKNVVIKAQEKEILKKVSGLAHPGEMLAIMGPSGAGKSTLLNAIAGRKQLSGGEVRLDGCPLTKAMRRKISYVLQQDIFLQELTFWDTLWYTALLRLPGSMPNKEKKRRVNEIIDDLDMRKCLKTIIGGATKRGLSGGEKKRANIACELLTNPALMLLDEPTSGLDSATAFSLMSTLKQFAQKSGKTVVSTIHQPSSQIFNMFDKLLLLCEGEVAYYGDIAGCAAYFAEIDLASPPNYNLADHILDVVKESDPAVKLRIKERARMIKFEELGPTDAASIEVISEDPPPYTEQPNSAMNGNMQKKGKGKTNSAYSYNMDPGGDVRFDDLETAILEHDIDGLKYADEYNSKWPTGFFLQFSVMFRRCGKQAFPVVLDKWRVIQSTVLSAYIGLMWFQTRPVESYLNDRLGFTFFMMAYSAFQGNAIAVKAFPAERVVINKERLAGYYRLSAYFMAKTVTETLMVLVHPFLTVTIAYWMAGLNNNPLVYLQLLSLIMMSSVVGHSIGIFYGALITDFAISFLASVTTCLFSMLSGGYYVTRWPFWLQWLRYVSFMRYLHFTMMRVDFYNKEITCDRFNTPYCKAMINDTVTPIPYTELMDYHTGRKEGFEIYYNLAIVAGYILLLKIASYGVLRYVRKPKAV